MSDAPERIWSTDEDGKWTDVEYVRADLFDALEAKRNSLRVALDRRIRLCEMLIGPSRWPLGRGRR